MRPVLVVWEDTTCQERWMSADEAAVFKTETIIQRGYLINEDENTLRISSTPCIGGEYFDVVAIPRKVVKIIKDLELDNIEKEHGV